MLCKSVECCGCGSCFNSCPQKCIEMKRNTEGFQYPIVDMEKCIGCKLCEQMCPVLNNIEKSEKSEAYAAINLDDELRKSSSSGGVFSELANAILRQNGYVCGAIYSEDFVVVHMLSQKEEDVNKMRGAKYAQSDAWKCFNEIKAKLEKGSLVLFVGTPCQVAGLKKFLCKDYESLTTVDMICHGVPSPMVWNHYVRERNTIDAKNTVLLNIELRNKDSGWSRYKYSVKFSYDNNSFYCIEQGNDIYMRGFVNNLFLRSSCANCQFKGVERCSDITLGDYWGIWDQYPEFDDNKGTSLVFVHTQKGEKLWSDIEHQFKRLQVNVDEAIQQNPSAVKSSKPHDMRSIFFEKYNEKEGIVKQIERQLNVPDTRNSSIGKKIVNRLMVWKK